MPMKFKLRPLLATLLLFIVQPGQAITLFDRTCRPASFTRRDDKFSGKLTREVTRTDRTVGESYEVIALGFRIYESGSNYAEYELDRKRRLGDDAVNPHRIKYRRLAD